MITVTFQCKQRSYRPKDCPLQQGHEWTRIAAASDLETLGLHIFQRRRFTGASHPMLCLHASGFSKVHKVSEHTFRTL